MRSIWWETWPRHVLCRCLQSSAGSGQNLLLSPGGSRPLDNYGQLGPCRGERKESWFSPIRISNSILSEILVFSVEILHVHISDILSGYTDALQESTMKYGGKALSVFFPTSTVALAFLWRILCSRVTSWVLTAVKISCRLAKRGAINHITASEGPH